MSYNYTQIVTEYAYKHGVKDTRSVVKFARDLIDSETALIEKHNIKQRCLNNQLQQTAVILAYKGEIPYNPEDLMGDPQKYVKPVTHSAPRAKHDMVDGSISLSLNSDEVMRTVTTYCYKQGLKTADAVSKEVSHLSAKVPDDLASSFSLAKTDIYPGAFVCLAMNGLINYKLADILV